MPKKKVKVTQDVVNILYDIASNVEDVITDFDDAIDKLKDTLSTPLFSKLEQPLKDLKNILIDIDEVKDVVMEIASKLNKRDC